jgi:3-phenylpropionate/trans-cinnamate dioxygenase ferredoxin subunit
MGNYVEAARANQITDGSKIKVKIQDHEIMLAKVNGNYYAIDNRCPHMGADLSAGNLEGTIVTCPRHGSQFDITNGNNVRWMKSSGITSSVLKAISSPKSVRSYKVKIEGDVVMVEL